MILKIYRWLKGQPGLDKTELSFLAPECGVRETVVIDGKSCIVQASCMAMGQAAGVMAALSAKRNTEPEQLPLSDVLSLLKKHGAIVPE